MKRRSFLKTIGCGGAACFVSERLEDWTCHAGDERTRPNILFILIDDLGWGDVGYHGSEILTPNIDSLADNGVRLEQHYVAPTCSPTRVSLLTGRFPSRYGVYGPVNEQVFEPGAVTLASTLHDCGYETSITGKWHMGSKKAWGPRQHGFDYSHGSFAGGVHPLVHKYKKGPYSTTWHRNDELIEEEGHVTDLIGREAVHRIEESSRSENPFFLYVALTAVHIPIIEPARWTSMYDGRIADESRRRFAACATHMDHWIGEMLEALDRTGQRKNTLIIISSDNGAQDSWKPAGRYPGEKPEDASPVLGSNRPLRGWKGWTYEGGIRVPALVNWPGSLEAREVQTPIHIADWMPTLCGLAGCSPPKSHLWDGKDVWPIVTGADKDPEPRTLYWSTGHSTAIRHGVWKLIIFAEDGKRELYDLGADPYEKNDLVETHSEKVAELQDLLRRQQAMDSREIVQFIGSSENKL